MQVPPHDSKLLDSTMEERVPRHWDPRPGPPWRSVLFWIPAVVFFFVYPLRGILWAFLAPRSFREGAPEMIRFWGRTLLWMFGVRVEEHGREFLEWPGAKIVLFNHVSILDLFLLAAHWPKQATVLYKAEFHRIPFVGRAMRLLDFIPVDLSSPEKARESVAEAAARIRERGATVLMSPEGSRSPTGGVQPFKMGAFHIAIQTRAPVVPMIMRGIHDLMPHGSYLARRGTVRIDYLAPVDTRDWNADDVHRHAAEIRQRFLNYLPAAPVERPGERTPPLEAPQAGHAA